MFSSEEFFRFEFFKNGVTDELGGKDVITRLGSVIAWPLPWEVIYCLGSYSLGPSATESPPSGYLASARAAASSAFVGVVLYVGIFEFLNSPI